MYNSNTFIFLFLCFCRDSSNNEYTGLFIEVDGGGTNAKLIVKGENTFNSNGGNDYGNGMYSYLISNSKLEVNVESGATLKSCGNNGPYDIGGVFPASATATFLGTGYYTCDQNRVRFFGPNAGTVVPPTCQACP